MEKQTNINTHSFCAKKWQVLFPTGFHFKVVVTLDYGVYMYLKQISLTYQGRRKQSVDGRPSLMSVVKMPIIRVRSAWQNFGLSYF